MLCADCQTAQNAVPSAGMHQSVPAEQRRAPGQISVTTVLVGINVAVFVAMLLTGVPLLEPTVEQLVKWGANWGPLSLGGQPWRILTSNYVHIGIIHIALNMWCLWQLGFLAERIFDRWTYVLLYTACGLAGSLTSLWWHPMVYGAGASGAIFGLAGALIAVLYLGKLPIAKEAVQGTLKSLLLFAGYNLFFGLKSGVDNSAHIGGLLSGFAMGAVLAGHVSDPLELRRRWRSNVLIGMGVMLLAANVYLRRHDRDIALQGNAQYSDVVAAQNGLKAIHQGHFDQAIPGLQKLVQLNPSSPEAYNLLGKSYFGAHRLDEAIASFQQALKLKPDFIDAELGLAVAYSSKGMQAESAQAFNKVMQLKAAQKK